MAATLRSATKNTLSHFGVPSRPNFMLIGQCVPCVKKNASKIRVKQLKMDTMLTMYFREDEYFYVTDPDKKCKAGDIVLIQELTEKVTKLVTHKILEIVHPFGDITDPITGKKVVVGKYRDEIARDVETYGKANSAFDYDKAPPRGWQEGLKDFTNKETYMKYHEFPENDPYAV